MLRSEDRLAIGDSVKTMVVTIISISYPRFFEHVFPVLVPRMRYDQ